MTGDDVDAIMRAVEEQRRLYALALDENAPAEARVAAAKAILDMAGYTRRPHAGSNVRTLDEIEGELFRVRAELARRERSALQ